MKELATVVNTAGKIATVQIEKKPECDSCKMCAFKNGKSRVKVKAFNAAGAKTGDEVLVKAERDNRLLASFIAYIVPVLFAGAGVGIGLACFEQELYAVLFCLAGLAVGFVAVFACDRFFSKTRGFGMEVVEILDNTTAGGCAETNGQAPATENEVNNQEEKADGTDV